MNDGNMVRLKEIWQLYSFILNCKANYSKAVMMQLFVGIDIFSHFAEIF